MNCERLFEATWCFVWRSSALATHAHTRIPTTTPPSRTLDKQPPAPNSDHKLMQMRDQKEDVVLTMGRNDIRHILQQVRRRNRSQPDMSEPSGSSLRHLATATKVAYEVFEESRA